MNDAPSPAEHVVYDEALFEQRVEGFKKAENPHGYQGFASATFLS